MAFHHVQQVPGCVFTSDAFTKSQLQQWGLGPKGMRFYAFRFTKHYHRLAGAELLTDLLNDPSARSVIHFIQGKGGEWAPLPGPVAGVQAAPVPCTLTRMDIFDKLTDPNTQPPIVRPGGNDLVRRMDDVVDGIQVSDNLREMLLCEESEHYELYSPSEQDQLLWRVFRHLALGGPCCQYEDKLEPLLDVAKRVYKELVSVVKNGSTGEIEVSTTAFRITGITLDTGQEAKLFPCPSPNSFMYLTVDVNTRMAKIWYHAFVPFW